MDRGVGISTAPKVQVLPKSSLNDEDLHIKAVGLRPYQRVTLKAHVFTESGRRRFESHAHYLADDKGTVEVERAPSLGGSYQGIEPMGLLWSLEPAPEIAHKRPRLVKRNIQKPFIYTFQLVDDVENIVMHSTSVERWYLASYVERHLVQHGIADGYLYIPKKKGSSDPMPVILDIRGAVPFLVEDRPSLMASHGFAVFSIDYFRKMSADWDFFGDIPKYFDLKIFLDLFDFIANHPRLDSSRVGIVSSCLGSVLALQAAARLKMIPIRCVAATGCLDILSYIQRWYQVTRRNNGRPLQMKERIERVGKGHLLETIHLEGAGHYIDAPYLPLCLQTIVGGEPRLHAYALNKAWRKTINWFRSKLNVTETYRVDWLDSPNHFVSSRM
ncbi:peroxisomal succinyl-coenzyme A thioesterase [Strongylocentrotus purpuratus]|uniref:Uncharacterized protein n=1 Tax=Strongylocentrotus purpuratus TaxID=7668 RepID=A0A7M7HGC6_STRPU|nr:peroxisomal succinyl-coenzyme A thioesterase [Strongylocentrotus purpuratus]